ncbi:putative T7SS-secreted protein [Streptomyces enissocaesilis]|uniref:Putative T7SS secretion signal domain-containing protein n=1 Tax=Streptomyces enissocaesilis TaxID=332589 RepID=A0ABP6K678_9ACTN
MAANPYPNLGWNPVPGLPGEVSELQRKVKAAASALSTSHGQITKLLGMSSSWEGDAADAFRSALDGELPQYMKNAADSLERAAAWLDKWDGDLSSHRDLAKQYDEVAGEKKTAADKAKQRHDEAGKNPDLQLGGRQYPSQEEADAATTRLRAAERSLNEAATHLTNANTAYNDVIIKARALEGDHSARAGVIASKLDEADDKLAPKEPGWFSKTLSAIGEGIKKAGEFLLEHAGTIGAIAGLLALFPTPLAPVFAGIAIVASAAAMSKNLASEDFRDSLMGEYGWKEGLTAWASVGGDALGMVPGVGVLARAGSEAGLAVAVAREGGEALSLGAKAGAFTSEVVPALSYKALDVATSSGIRDYAINGINVVANTASSLESHDVLPDDGYGHDTAEATKAFAAGSGAWDTSVEIVTDLGEFARGIRL